MNAKVTFEYPDGYRELRVIPMTGNYPPEIWNEWVAHSGDGEIFIPTESAVREIAERTTWFRNEYLLPEYDSEGNLLGKFYTWIYTQARLLNRGL